MPLNKCQINNQPGWKWGQKGKCYEYTPGDEESIKEAKKKAISQGVAIGDYEALSINIGVIRGTYDLSEDLAITITSFDWDGTLSTTRGKDLWLRTPGKKYIITARSEANIKEIREWATKNRVPLSNIFAVGSNNAKIQKIKELKVQRHWDNNNSVIIALPGIGRLF